MYRFVLVFLLLGNALMAGASPLWMRYCAISPDGSEIAFAYKGDIYVVDSRGGMARQLTTGDSYESSPVWSHDGEMLAFISDREGGMDIFTVASAGGAAQRVTTHSTRETLLGFSPDDRQIYFSATIQDPASSAMFPDAWITELYRIPVEGGRPELVLAAPVCNLSFDKDGKSFIYENRTGSENIWRKHHTSSVARDIFYYDAAQNTHTLLTENPGEDRSPIYTPDGGIVFLSERNGGSFNVYPGENGPVDSIHYEVFHEALQDLRALKLLERKIGREAVLAFLKQGRTERFTMTDYPRDPEYLLELRPRIYAELAKA